MAVIEELAARALAARTAAHRAHWRTASYSAHMALGDFYQQVGEAIDEVVECHQGVAGLLEPFTVEDAGPGNIVDYLDAEVRWIETNRDAAAAGSTAVANLIDSLIGVYRVALYKLRNLS